MSKRAGAWLLLTLLVLAGVATRLAVANEETVPDPVAIRRLVLPPDQIVKQLQRVQQGSLVLLPRTEFESRVRQAAAAVGAARRPPRLMEAHYRARVAGSGLTDGTADWHITNPSGISAILPIPALNLALTEVKVETGPKQTTPAVLGDLRGKGLGLLISSARQVKVHLGWTARGEERAGDLHFSLQVPACPVATLDLDLPVGRAVMPGEQFLVSGPFATDAPTRQRWRIAFAGRSALELVVRAEISPKQFRAPALAQLRTTLALEPALLTGDYEFNLEVPQHQVGKLTFLCDPTLQPTEVQAPDLASWNVRDAGAGKPLELVLQFRQPFRSGLVQIHCVAPLLMSKRWTVPTIQLRDGLTTSEHLTLQVQRDIQLVRWQRGAFRFTQSPVGDPFSTQQDRQVLALVRNDLGPRAARPSAELRLGETELHLRQRSWWEVRPNGSTFTVQLGLEVARGRLFHLAFVVPSGWQVSDVGLPEWVRHWTTFVDQGRTILAIDLLRPLTRGLTAQGLIHLRAGSADLGPHTQDGIELPFPDLVPRQVCFREGTLAIHVDPRYQAEAQARLTRDTEPSLEVEPPWGNQPPDFAYRYRELISPTNASTPVGRLRLRPRHAQYRARCTERLLFPAGRPAVAIELVLQPVVGSPNTVDLLVSAPVTSAEQQRSQIVELAKRLAPLASPLPWTTLGMAAWRPPVATWVWHIKDQPKRVLAAHPYRVLPIAMAVQTLAARHPLNAAAMMGAVPWGECWRLTLPASLTTPLVLQTTMELRDQPAAAREDALRQWAVPLVAVAGAASMEGTVTIEEGALEQQQIDFSGSATGQQLRYGDWPARLVVSGRLRPPRLFDAEAIDAAEWTSWLRPDGSLLHHYRFEVRNWPQRTLPVRLPADAHLVAAWADKRWLQEAPALHEVQGAVQLPVPAGNGPHTLELLYQTTGSTAGLWTTVQAEPPALPLTPLISQHRWRLPPGMVPLAGERYDQLPAANVADELAALRRGLTSVHRTMDTVGSGWLFPADAGQGQHRLTQDAAALWKAGPSTGQRWRLASWLDRLVFRNLQGRVRLIVDAEALAQAGIRRDTWLPAPPASQSAGVEPWKSVGLVIVPGRTALLLTSRRQFETWEANGHISAGLPLALEQALSEAAEYGQNRAGRFRALADWLGRPATASGDSMPQREVGLWTEMGGPWTAWQLQPGHADETNLVLVRQDTVRVAAWMLTVVLGTVWMALGRRGNRLRLFFHLAWLGCAGLALLWLPAVLTPLAWWPALVGAVLLVGWYGAFLLSAPRIRPVVPAVLGIGVLSAGLAGQAEPVQPTTVYVLPDSPAGGTEKVLAPPSLLAELRTLASRGPDALDRAALLSARYEGTAGDSGADLRAQFTVYTFGRQTVSLVLPLGGVDLQEARLDGESAHPTALLPPQDGYRLDLKGAGRHTVVVRFHVPITADGAGRELRFAVPELPRSQLSLVLPAAARYSKAVGARGAQRSTADNAGIHLEADLGRTSVLRVRWRQAAGPESVSLRVREGYLWQLRPSGSTLMAVLQYTVDRGAATELAVQLPDDLEVRRVEVGRLPDASSEEVPPRYRSWTVTDRRLRVQLQRPLTHGAQLTLTLVPRHPLGATPRLIVPVPLNARPVGEPGTEPLLAYSVEEATARLTDNLGVSRQDDRTAFQELWWDAGQADAGSELNVFAFQRGPGAAPYLQLAITTPPAMDSCLQTITWQVGPEKAEVTALVELKATERDLALVEWEVGDVTVAEVSGPNVRGWSQAGRVVQVWLQHPVAQTTLRLTGWIPRNSAGADFHLAALPVHAVGSTSTTVEVTSRGELQLEPQSLTHLRLLPESQPSARQRYRADQPDYAAAFRLRPPQPRAQVETLTSAELRNGKVAVETLVTCRPGNTEQHLSVSVHHIGTAEVRLEAPGASVRPVMRPAIVGRSWRLTVPASPAVQHWRLHGVLTPEPDAELALPTVEVAGAARVESWVAIVGPELRAAYHTFLTPVPSSARALPRWPQWRKRYRPGSLIWKTTRPDWQLHMRPHLTVAGSAPIRLFLEEQTARVVDGRHWLHESDCLLYHESDTDLRITLPPGARLVDALVDGEPSTSGEPQGGTVRVPLTGRWGVRRLRLRWQFEDEAFDSPRLDRPRLAGITNGPALWTVYVPAEFLMKAAGGTDQAAPADAADADLVRAEAELELSSVLAQGRALDSERFTHRLRASQERFAWFCAQADRHQRGKGTRDTRLQQLRQRNRRLAESRGFEELRGRAEQSIEQPSLIGLPASVIAPGLPYRWTGSSKTAAPALHLLDRSIERQERAIALSIVLLVALVIVGMVWHTPGADVWAQRLWPEQLVLIGLAGWLWAPAGWVFLLLLLVGMVVRIAQTGMQLAALMRTRLQKTRPGSNGSAAS